MQNDPYSQSESPPTPPDLPPAQPVQSAAMPQPIASDQAGMSVFPSSIENGSLPVQPGVPLSQAPVVGPQVSSTFTDQPAAPDQLPSEQPVAVLPVTEPALVQPAMATADPTIAQPPKLQQQSPPAPQAAAPASSGISVDPTLRSAVDQAVSPAKLEPRPKVKSTKQWIALGVIAVLTAAAVYYFYTTANRALDHANQAAQSFRAGIEQPYLGAYAESGKKAYQIYIPNGSDIVIDPQGDMIVFHGLGEGKSDVTKLGYIDGVGGGDRPTLAAWTQKRTSSMAVEGAKPTSPFYADGVQVKYYHRAYLPDEDLDGRPAEGGEKVYRYVFEYDGKQTIIDYFIKRQDEDKSEMVGKMASTLKFERTKPGQPSTSTEQ